MARKAFLQKGERIICVKRRGVIHVSSYRTKIPAATRKPSRTIIHSRISRAAFSQNSIGSTRNDNYKQEAHDYFPKFHRITD
jgi:hypothetical protein